MKPEKQRIAIAEARGWTCCGHVEGCHPHGLHPSRSVHDYSFKQVMNMEVPLDDLPDYLNDRNALIEAVKSLPMDQRMTLLAHLDYCGVAGEWEILTVDPDKLAEAFLRTVNKWEDGEE